MSEEFGRLLLKSLGHITLLRPTGDGRVLGPRGHDPAILGKPLGTEQRRLGKNGLITMLGGLSNGGVPLVS